MIPKKGDTVLSISQLETTLSPCRHANFDPSLFFFFAQLIPRRDATCRLASAKVTRMLCVLSTAGDVLPEAEMALCFSTRLIAAAGICLQQRYLSDRIEHTSIVFHSSFVRERKAGAFGGLPRPPPSPSPSPVPLPFDSPCILIGRVLDCVSLFFLLMEVVLRQGNVCMSQCLFFSSCPVTHSPCLPSHHLFLPCPSRLPLK